MFKLYVKDLKLTSITILDGRSKVHLKIYLAYSGTQKMVTMVGITTIFVQMSLPVIRNSNHLLM